ncbi:MAG: hypothetical protein IT519_07830 [Burkholderiales bacterium]|nr:hypothetical protein [Burkholderiales bacterium]
MPRRCGWMLVLCGAAFAGLSPVVLGGVDEWTTTGPRDGWPFAVADPLRAKHLFVGKSGSEALYASTDGGGTFTRVLSLPPQTLPQYPYSVPVAPGALATDPSRSDEVWLGASDGSVRRTANGGQDWSIVRTGSAFGSQWNRLVVAPWGTGEVLGINAGALQRKRASDADFTVGPPAWDVAARADRAGEWLLVAPQGVSKSTDAGATWSPVPGAPTFACGAVLAASPVDPTRFFALGRFGASDTGARIYRSDDAGATWAPGALLATQGCAATLAPDPVARDRVVALLTSDDGLSTTLVRSMDAGATFAPVDVPGGAGRSFTVDADGTLCLTNSIGLLCSASGGGPWRAIETDLPGEAADDLRIARGQPGYVMVPGRSKAFGEAGWRSISAGPFGYQGLGVTGVGDEGRFLAVIDEALAESFDGGSTWRILRGLPSLVGMECKGLAVAPGDSARLIRFSDFEILSSLINPGCLGVSRDGGATFEDLASTPFNQGGGGALRVAFDPQDANLAWLLGEPRAGSAGGFFRSSDGGSTWSPVAGANGTWIVIDPADGRRMLVGPPISYSEDRGATWVPVNGSHSFAWGADVDWTTDPPQVYAATSAGIWTAAWKSSASQPVAGSEDLVAFDVRVAAPRGVAQRATVYAATTTGVWELTRSSGLPFVPVFRFFNKQTGAHFYTASADERDFVIATWPQFAYEGEKFRLLAAPAAGAVPVFRFFNTQTGVHFYTDDEAEKDHVMATWPQFVFEGTAFYAFRADPGTARVHRFFNTATGAHFYTTSGDEAFTVVHNWPQFVDEGLRWAVYPVAAH